MYKIGANVLMKGTIMKKEIQTTYQKNIRKLHKNLKTTMQIPNQSQRTQNSQENNHTLI